MKIIKSIFMVLLMGPLCASIYISDITNNTKQHLSIAYAVPANIKARIPGQSGWDTTHVNHYPALNSHGIEVNPGLRSQWNIRLGRGKAVQLKDAYIPTTPFNNAYDTVNVITLKTGVPGDVFALIRVHDGYMEILCPHKSHAPIRVFDEKLVDGSSYSLEVIQISDELYFAGRYSQTSINLNAFKVSITKNS
jgi:hypothetical protein